MKKSNNKKKIKGKFCKKKTNKKRFNFRRKDKNIIKSSILFKDSAKKK